MWTGSLHVVRGQQGTVERDIGWSGELILGRVVGSHVDDGVDIGLRERLSYY